MKNLYLCIFLTLLICNVNAQWVTIPDNNFRIWLTQNYPQCMSGNQMDTSCTEIVTETVVSLGYTHPISDLTGIEFFDSLKYLFCSYIPLTNLPALPGNLSKLYITETHLTTLPFLPEKIDTLHLSSNQLSSLPSLPDSLIYLFCDTNFLSTLPALPSKLRFLSCNVNQITALPSLPPMIRSLYCSYNLLSVLPSLPDSLNELRCYNNSLTSLPTLPPKLKYLYSHYNQITSLPSLPDSLKVLYIMNNQLTTLPPLSSVSFLQADSNQITQLPTLNSSISSLYLNYNQISSLPQLPNSLKYLFIDNNLVTSLPELPDTMYYLSVSNNINLKCLPELKTITNLFFQNTDIECLPNFGNVNSSWPALSTVPTCDIININNCDIYWNIAGKTYFDSNNNCVVDINEPGIPNLKINLYENGNLIQQTYSVGGGTYSFTVNNGTYSYMVDTAGIPVFVTCPISGTHNSVISGTAPLDTSKNFAVQCKPGFDVGVKYINRMNGQFFPGDIATINIGVGDMTNFYGIQCASGIAGSVTVEITGPVNYLSEAPGSLIPSVAGNVLNYAVSDFGQINFHTDFNFIVQTDTNTQAGTQISFKVNVSPFTDNDSTNNELTAYFLSVNSFDPNEKEVSPPGEITPTHEWLTYTIHFQNTGNALAQNIYIVDTLDQNLDVSSFTLLTYSHFPETEIYNNTAVFGFKNINLPDSTNDEPNSHGFVQYKIKINPGLPTYTMITNKADIYFDYNSPITTNITYTEIKCPFNASINPNIIGVCPGKTDTLWTQVYDNYQWYKNDTLITGATEQYFVINASYINSVISVLVSLDGCSQPSQYIYVSDYSNPPIPIITMFGNYLTTQTGFTYQWYLNGNSVGTNSNTLQSQGPGSYTVTITNANGCTATSSSYVVTSIIENSLSGTVNVNYNSSTQTLNISRSNATNETAFFVLDVIGRVVADEKMAKGISEAELQIQGVKPGIYFVKTSDGGNTVKFFVE